jgi:RHS repeat-associated protein
MNETCPEHDRQTGVEASHKSLHPQSQTNSLRCEEPLPCRLSRRKVCSQIWKVSPPARHENQSHTDGIIALPVVVGFWLSAGRRSSERAREARKRNRTNNQWQIYTYDAGGRRIKRNVNGVETWNVYGMGGELLAEYKSGAAPFLPAKEYGYRGGELLVTIASGDDVRLSRFVTNLYYGAKQTDPTSQQLQDAVNQLAAAGATSQSQLLTVASQIARSLFTGTNYESSRSDAQYVADLYYAYLQRGPDDSGLGWWTGQVASNGRNAFEGSSEFITLVATLYGTAASDNERTEHLVNDFYLGAYGRNATSTELQQQRDALNAAASQGMSQVQAQAESFGRSLFAAQVNDAAIWNMQFVTNLYEAFLQRGPDAGGLSFWSGQATVGQGRQNVLGSFATCGSFYELAGTLYREAFWLISDRLGTPRMVVNKSGTLASVKRHDYLPFGEELYAGTGGRTTPQGYSGDSVRQHFTGYEADAETGLNFAEARYQSSAQGRFTSVDPLGASASVGDPQSFNRYSYVNNNPVNFVDPTGMSLADIGVLQTENPETAKIAEHQSLGARAAADRFEHNDLRLMARLVLAQALLRKEPQKTSATTQISPSLE